MILNSIILKKKNYFPIMLPRDPRIMRFKLFSIIRSSKNEKPTFRLFQLSKEMEKLMNRFWLGVGVL